MSKNSDDCETVEEKIEHFAGWLIYCVQKMTKASRCEQTTDGGETMCVFRGKNARCVLVLYSRLFLERSTNPSVPFSAHNQR